jgi:hypothetical protein
MAFDISFSELLLHCMTFSDFCKKKKRLRMSVIWLIRDLFLLETLPLPSTGNYRSFFLVSTFGWDLRDSQACICIIFICYAYTLADPNTGTCDWRWGFRGSWTPPLEIHSWKTKILVTFLWYLYVLYSYVMHIHLGESICQITPKKLQEKQFLIFYEVHDPKSNIWKIGQNLTITKRLKHCLTKMASTATKIPYFLADISQ